jgi:hypothetical protein
MGWTFLYNAPEKRHVIEDVTREGETVKCVRKSTVGNHLWTIWERKEDGHKFIVLFLLARDRGNWGYKDMTESMHPYYYDCPLSFLDEVPVASEDWREGVINHHSAEKNRRRMLKSLTVGKTVRLKQGYKPSELRVVSMKPLIGEAGGNRYRLQKTKITEVF